MGQTLTGIIRMAVMGYFAMKFFSPKRPSSSAPSQLISSIFEKGEPLDMWVYLSVKEKFNDFANEDVLIWHEANVPYAAWGPASSRSHSLNCIPSEAAKHNGSLYAHVFFARSGYPPDPNDPEYQPQTVFGRTHRFIMMCPQLFINYKLKSVAHLPWRQMTYKFLNTIIDDLFAFVIKVPMLHRLSVFRDVDKKRVNEFGFGGEDEDQVPVASGSSPAHIADAKSENNTKTD